MIQIDAFKQALDDLANQFQTGAEYGPDAFNRNIPICVIDLVRSRLGLSEQYQPGQPVSAMGYELTQVVTGELSDLKVSDASLVVNTQGLASMPSDYFYPSSLFHNYIDSGLKAKYDKGNKKPCGHFETVSCTCASNSTQMTVKQLRMQKIINAADYYMKAVPITILDDATFNQMRNNSIRKPELKYPICRLNGTNVEFLPKNIGTVFFTYIRYPKTPFWNYQIDPTTFVATHIVANSQNIELPPSLITPLLGLMLSRAGIKSREDILIQVGEKLNVAGK